MEKGFINWVENLHINPRELDILFAGSACVLAGEKEFLKVLENAKEKKNMANALKLWLAYAKNFEKEFLADIFDDSEFPEGWLENYRIVENCYNAIMEGEI